MAEQWTKWGACVAGKVAGSRSQPWAFIVFINLEFDVWYKESVFLNSKTGLPLRRKYTA